MCGRLVQEETYTALSENLGVDEAGQPAYLESSNPKNVPVYERFGFQVMGHVAPGDFPGLSPMWRPARG